MNKESQSESETKDISGRFFCFQEFDDDDITVLLQMIKTVWKNYKREVTVHRLCIKGKTKKAQPRMKRNEETQRGLLEWIGSTNDCGKRWAV